MPAQAPGRSRTMGGCEQLFSASVASPLSKTAWLFSRTITPLTHTPTHTERTLILLTLLDMTRAHMMNSGVQKRFRWPCAADALHALGRVFLKRPTRRRGWPSSPRQTARACLRAQSVLETSELGLGVRAGDDGVGRHMGVPGPEAAEEAAEGAAARGGRALGARERMSASMSLSVISSARRSGSPNTCRGKAQSHGA